MSIFVEYWVLILFPLLIGIALDALLGDPDKPIPHPMRGFGWAISNSERWLYRGEKCALRWRGALLTSLLCGLVWLIFWGLGWIFSTNIGWQITWASLWVFYSLGHTTLKREARAVEKALGQSLDAGRAQVARIVGRETHLLSAQQIRMATLETLSENLSDGVIAPLFYYVIGGVPAALTYKMINTLDSMIGYRNARYQYFGMFAARLDDVANWIPARLTALLMLASRGKLSFAPQVWQEAKQHVSPNAGYPEAALAVILQCQLGGPTMYHGKYTQKAYLGRHSRALSSEDITQATQINNDALIVFVALVFSVAVLSGAWFWVSA